jgi:hypothetical protein
MKMKFQERRKVMGTALFIGLFTAFLFWASYRTFTTPQLKPGLIFFGSLLFAGGIWNGYLFAVMCAALAKMKKPIQPPVPTRGNGT